MSAWLTIKGPHVCPNPGCENVTEKSFYCESCVKRMTKPPIRPSDLRRSTRYHYEVTGHSKTVYGAGKKRVDEI